MDLNDLNKVWEIKPLVKIGEDEARKILEQVANQVQPIMRKRHWKVRILSEFWYSSSFALIMISLQRPVLYIGWNNELYLLFVLWYCSPPNPSLMGLNIGGGAEIKLRLRRQNNEWAFFPYQQILDTMLHELCHNEVGPHNADFYKLLDEIRKVKDLQECLSI